MIAEFDVDGDGTIDFPEFLHMMDILGWSEASLSEEELKGLQVSYYGQASICRWLDDASTSTGTGDVTGADVGPVTRTCRKIAMARPFELVVYMCIFTAAVISGLQSYKVDSEYEHATWALVADFAILILFTAEIGDCLREHKLARLRVSYDYNSHSVHFRAYCHDGVCLNSLEDPRRGQQTSAPLFLGSLEYVCARLPLSNLLDNSARILTPYRVCVPIALSRAGSISSSARR